MGERGICSDKNSPEYQQAEKEYARLYAQNWRNQNRDKYVAVKLMFPKHDYSRVVRCARESKLPIATLIKRVVLDYTRQTVYTPPNEWLQEATKEINRIGTLINNQTRHIHTVRRLSEQDYQFLLNQLTAIRQTLNRVYSQPLPLRSFLTEALKKGGTAARKEIQDVLTQFDSDHDN